MRLSVLATLMMILTGCVSSAAPPQALDRLEAPARAHAKALTTDNLPEIRATGRTLLAQLAALAQWPSH